MTYLYLWAIPTTALIMFACVPYFWGYARLFALLLAVLFIWLSWALDGVQVMAGLLAKADTEVLGRIGDLFGGVNALFSALAFVGVAIAANFQFRSNRQAHVQTFETSFYSAIDLLHRISEGLRFDPRIFPNLDLEQIRRNAGLPPRAVTIFEGREVFAEVVRCIKGMSNSYRETLENYRKLQDEHNYVLGHYFRHLYQVLKMIDRQVDDVLSKEQKRSYASILRAQLSTSELALLMLNCAEDVVDAGQFRNLLVRYCFLEHLPIKRATFVYYAADSKLFLSTVGGIKSFLVEEPIPPQSPRNQGAFGQNPTSITTK